MSGGDRWAGRGDAGRAPAAPALAGFACAGDQPRRGVTADEGGRASVEPGAAVRPPGAR